MASEEKGREEDLAQREDSKAEAGVSGPAPRFEIKKWNAVTMWSWDICADTCAICRNSLNEPSIEYQVRPAASVCDLASVLEVFLTMRFFFA